MVAAVLAAGGAALAVGWVVLGDEVPRWSREGAAMVPTRPLPSYGDETVGLAAGGTIVAQGDSLTRGAHGGAVAGRPYPEILEGLLGDGIRVANRGIGGHRAHDGARHWRGRDGGNLVIVMYGTNDAAVRGRLGRFRPVPLGQFGEELTGILRWHREQGAQVVVLAPPPTGSAAMERRIEPYRHASRQAAIAADAIFWDPAPAFAGLSAPLQHDGLHFRAEANRALARWLGGRLVVEAVAEPDPRPSGKAGQRR